MKDEVSALSDGSFAHKSTILCPLSYTAVQDTSELNAKLTCHEDIVLKSSYNHQNSENVKLLNLNNHCKNANL